jgi:hypothetical protein
MDTRNRMWRCIPNWAGPRHSPMVRSCEYYFEPSAEDGAFLVYMSNYRCFKKYFTLSQRRTTTWVFSQKSASTLVMSLKYDTSFFPTPTLTYKSHISSHAFCDSFELSKTCNVLSHTLNNGLQVLAQQELKRTISTIIQLVGPYYVTTHGVTLNGM